MTLEEIKKLVEPLSGSLWAVENRIFQEAISSDFDFINRAAQHIALDEGKRLRPILVLAVGRVLGSVTEEHVLFAVISELLHTATLLHDDVLDDAQVRRHRKSVNSEWGNTTSVLLGDYLFARAFMLLSSLQSYRLFTLVSETTKDICEGELLQVNSSHRMDLTEGDYFRMIQKKTASLFASSCRGGAIIAGAPDAWVEVLGQYGDALGQAFQIGDDILDLAGNVETEGKTLGTDLKKGKLTLPMIHLLPHLEKSARKILEDIITEKREDVSELEIQGWLMKGQGLSETLEVMTSLCDRAQASLDSLSKDLDLTLFRTLPEYILSQAKLRLSSFDLALR
ncbi:MAG: polyprenyl synthetase family protein [Chlamydiae bacterium]|nr:polyprenyl synthetase family protein [Chlamydiota bacterium]MBI3265982.1 polyprenyl synthetase family protein [Chlamydiota bacterium]